MCLGARPLGPRGLYPGAGAQLTLVARAKPGFALRGQWPYIALNRWT